MNADQKRDSPVYHLTPVSELRAGSSDASYAPARLGEDGFVHCAGSPEVTLAVAADYFASCPEPVAVLRIDPGRLTAELRFEAPAPIEGGGSAHLARADSFPHVYGPIDRAAIEGAGLLGLNAGVFVWPERFGPLDALLDPP